MKQKSQASRFDDEYPFFVQMRRALLEKMREILKNPNRFDKPIDGPRCVGVEIEVSCIKNNGLPLDEETRNKLIQEHNEIEETDKGRFWQKELGSSQIEIMTQPINLSIAGGLNALKFSMIYETSVLVNTLKKVNAFPVRLGSDPIVKIDGSGRTTTEDRYRLVPDFHRSNRRQGMQATIGMGDGQVRVDNPAAVVAMSSVQFNLDCYSISEAIDLLNRCIVTGPYAVALGANARFLDGKDTGFSDIRGAAWEVSHDIRTHSELLRGVSARSGPPNRIFSNLQDYFVDVFDQPSILNNPERAFEIACGLYWRDTRIKFLRLGQTNEQIVVEFRPVSLQPNAFEDYAIMAFSFGHVLGSKQNSEVLLPIQLTHENRWSAMINGLRGMMWVIKDGTPINVPSTEAVRLQIQTVIDGLRSIHATNDDIKELMEVWERRLVDGTPSDMAFIRLQDLWQKQSFGSCGITRDLLHEFILTNYRH